VADVRVTNCVWGGFEVSQGSDIEADWTTTKCGVFLLVGGRYHWTRRDNHVLSINSSLTYSVRSVAYYM
jgi:hypothetical protein